MERPNIKNFFSESTTPQMINNTLLGEPELYKFIQAQDAYIDNLEEQIAKGGQAEVLVMPKIADVIEECAKIAETYEPDEKLDYVTYASKEIRKLKKKFICH